MVSTIRSACFNIAFFGTTIILALAAVPAAPFMSGRAMRRYARFWMRCVQAELRFLVGLGFEVRGLENLPPQPVIIAAKHQSAWETLFFHMIRPDVVFGLKHELGRIPIFGWYLRIGGSVFIDRGGAARALRSLVEGCKERVAKGCSVVIFPEGTRRPPGSEPAYHSGVAALYAGLEIPVVPVALNSGSFWRRRSFIKRPGTITVEFLPPIPPGLPRRAFMERLESAIEERQAVLDQAARQG